MCIIDCLSTIVFILPLYLDDTKVIILILWRRTFQLEYWRTFQLVSTIIINSLFKGIGFWGYEKSLIHLFVHQALIYRVRGF